MHFTKMQGVGNDFVVIEEDSHLPADLPGIARTLCQRQFSIGADGLLVIGKGTENTAFSFRMFNPDGSEDMCGNGLRCASLWAYKRGPVGFGDIAVSTKDGIRECHLLLADSGSAIVRVNMGPAFLNVEDLPAIGDVGSKLIAAKINVAGRIYVSTVVNTGSTHSVIFRNRPVGEDEFQEVSPLFETLPKFPERTSVLWAWSTGINQFFVRIWERGAGETFGCGTGACAVGVAAILNDFADRKATVTVASRGGELQIAWDKDIWMTGPAKLVYEGVIS